MNMLQFDFRKYSRLVAVTLISLIVQAPWSSTWAQKPRDDVQLQILMVQTPGTFDRKGQRMTFQVKDKQGMPVMGAGVTFKAENGTFTDEEGRAQGTTITYYTDAQGRVEIRVRRNKASGFVALNTSASFLDRTGAKNFHVEVPSPPIGAGLKVATALAIGGAAAAAAVVASKTPSKPAGPPATVITVGGPSVR
jgi:hypothetical protein